MYLIPIIVGTIAFAVLAPVVGCLLAGLDRKLSARMQGRVGPPILQPYYDLRKLLEKDRAAVNNVEGTYITCALVFAIVAGGIFFGGGNLLLSVFVLTLSSLFFILAAYCTRSPYSEVGAAREALQIMAEEPMSLFIAVVFFLATGSFNSCAVFGLEGPADRRHLDRIPGLPVHPHHQDAQKPLRPELLASCAPGARQGHHHRDERPHACEGGGHALV